MENRRCLICPILLLVFAPGCLDFHQYRPVAVLARDAETKKPIPGAEVRISYPMSRTSQAPANSTGTTGTDGIARLRAAPFGDDGVLIEAGANGYMPENQTLSVAFVQEIKPAHLFEDVEKRPVSYVLELYADPHPAVELVVPTGYRGIVKAAIQVQPDASAPAGQRLFSYTVPPSGVIQIAGPPLLGRVGAGDYRIKYVDGTVLSGEAKGPELGFWCVKVENNFLHFLIGTRYEYEALRPSSNTDDTGSGRSSGAKGGGQSRKGRKGGSQQPTDPGP